jgi:hypothetical protein
MDGSEGEAGENTTYSSNLIIHLYEDVDFMLTFQDATANNRNWFCNGLSLQSMHSHSGKIHCYSLLSLGIPA